MEKPYGIFIPKYSFILKSSFAMIPIYLALGIWILRSQSSDLITYLSAVFMLVMSVSFPFVWIRRIKFAEKIIVERFLLPPREIPYSDILDVGLVVIKFKKRKNISLYGMKNASEFTEKLEYSLALQDVPRDQIEGKLAGQETRAWTSSAYAGITATLLTMLIAFFGPPWTHFAGRLTILVIYIPLYATIILIIKATTQSK